MPVPHTTATIERFWAKVAKAGPDDCWLWTQSLNRDGYAPFGIGKRKFLAHRIAYEISVGPIPENLVLDHLCDNPACVNPAHLEAVPQSVNTQRAFAQRTHCKNGHPLTDEVKCWDRFGVPYMSRRCLICLNAKRRARRSKTHRKPTP